jgi:hypothetical protein
MPWIQSYRMPIFLRALPLEIPRPYTVLRRPGMAAGSVLFHGAGFDPFALPTLASAPTRDAARRLANNFAAMRAQRVRVDDDLVAYDGTVVLDCRSEVRDAGLVLGGTSVGDRWEVATLWTLLFDPGALR